MRNNEKNFGVGDRVKLISDTLAWNAEAYLRGKIGEVIAIGEDGRVSICFDNGRLLRGRTTEAFELS